jgi:hypothetical protein
MHEEHNVARPPRGKRTSNPDGTRAVAAKNPNGIGSVYYEPPKPRADGRKPAGRWRATWTDHGGKIRKVSAATRSEVETKRDGLAAAAEQRRRPPSRFSVDTTVNELLDQYAPFTVLNCRKVCRQAFIEAVKLDLIATNPFDLVTAPPAKRVEESRALSPEDAKARIRWGAAYTPSKGTVLGATKTAGAQGIHHLAPISVEQLRRRQVRQDGERAQCAEEWPSPTSPDTSATPMRAQPRATSGALVNVRRRRPTHPSVRPRVRRHRRRHDQDPARCATSFSTGPRSGTNANSSGCSTSSSSTTTNTAPTEASTNEHPPTMPKRP